MNKQNSNIVSGYRPIDLNKMDQYRVCVRRRNGKLDSENVSNSDYIYNNELFKIFESELKKATDMLRGLDGLKEQDEDQAKSGEQLTQKEDNIKGIKRSTSQDER